MSDPMSLEAALRIKLEGAEGPVVYSDLSAHLARDAVFVVAPGVSLVACGVAVATDAVEQVEAWVREGSLRKPSQAERDSWPDQARRIWNAIVIQPFVLVQDPRADLERREAGATVSESD